MHSAVNAALRHPCHKVEVFIVLVFNCFATPQRLFFTGRHGWYSTVTLYKYINIIQSPQQFSEILAPCRPFLLHLLTHRRIFKNLTPYISTPSIILPPIRMFPRRRGEQSMCRECAGSAQRGLRGCRECVGSVQGVCRPQDDGRSMGSAGSDMTISGLRRGPKGISKIKISETAEAESEDTGEKQRAAAQKNDREPRPVPCRFSDGVGKTKRT